MSGPRYDLTMYESCGDTIYLGFDGFILDQDLAPNLQAHPHHYSYSRDLSRVSRVSFPLRVGLSRTFVTIVSSLFFLWVVFVVSSLLK